MDGARREKSVKHIIVSKIIKVCWADVVPEHSVKHIDLVQKKELFAYGGLADNAAGIRSSSALRNACVSWAVEFGGARRAEPEEGPQGPDAADNRLLGVGRAPPCLGTKYL